MRIYTQKNTLSALKVNDVDAKDLSEKFEILNDNLRKKFKENSEKEYKSKIYAKEFMITPCYIK